MCVIERLLRQWVCGFLSPPAGRGGARRRSRGPFGSEVCAAGARPKRRGERGADRLPARPMGSREKGREGGSDHRARGSGRRPARGAFGSWPRASATSATGLSPKRFALSACRAAPALPPGRARPPPRPGGAPFYAPETGRRRAPGHRRARAGPAPRQPCRPAGRGPRKATAGRAAARIEPRRHSAMPPHVTTPRERAPLPGGTTGV